MKNNMKIGDKLKSIKPSFYRNPVCGYHTTVDKEYEIIDIKEIPQTNYLTPYGNKTLEEKKLYVINGDLGVKLMLDYGDNNFDWDV
jgi:hypothetical protein